MKNDSESLTLPSVLACPLHVVSGLETAVLRRLDPPSANLTTRGWEEVGPATPPAPDNGLLLKIEMICSHFSRLSILDNQIHFIYMQWVTFTNGKLHETGNLAVKFAMDPCHDLDELEMLTLQSPLLCSSDWSL